MIVGSWKGPRPRVDQLTCFASNLPPYFLWLTRPVAAHDRPEKIREENVQAAPPVGSTNTCTVERRFAEALKLPEPPMANRSLHPLIHQLLRRAAPENDGGASDGQLLERFVGHQDESPFR